MISIAFAGLTKVISLISAGVTWFDCNWSLIALESGSISFAIFKSKAARFKRKACRAGLLLNDLLLMCFLISSMLLSLKILSASAIIAIGAVDSRNTESKSCSLIDFHQPPQAA